MSTPDLPTAARRWADEARLHVNALSPDNYARLLHADFVQESRRSAPFTFNREQALGSVDTMRQMGLHVGGIDVAVAGAYHLLTQRRYEHRQGVVELLAVTAWTTDGLLLRMIEFELDALDDAMVELGTLAGEDPIIVNAYW
ncbi:MAG: hypothetical protein HRT86_03420 [Ilumatobacteraceae bacterium]|nr:hypothetical protein [Ilumatobacteraceae bacterium]